MLRDELSGIREELADGAEQMSRLSMERLSLSAYVDELKGLRALIIMYVISRRSPN